jgi:Uma2 family endonuclease
VSPADQAPRSAVSVEAFLANERVAQTKHELWAGEVFAMAGASYSHNKIVVNLARELSNALRAKPCDVLPSDMKVFVPSKPGVVYPDISIVCGAPRFRDDERDVLLNPSVVVEVLSESTERFDRGEKFAGYRSVESVRQVVLISQTERRVEIYTRAAAGRWMLEEATASAIVALEAVGCEIALDEIYLKVFETGTA